jgi:hypothetical protein
MCDNERPHVQNVSQTWLVGGGKQSRLRRIDKRYTYYFPSLSLRLANDTPANMQTTHIIANALNGIYCDKSKAIVIPSLLLMHYQ